MLGEEREEKSLFGVINTATIAQTLFTLRISYSSLLATDHLYTSQYQYPTVPAPAPLPS